jgi:hypothetical protein
VMRELGYTDDTIDAMVRRGVAAATAR